MHAVCNDVRLVSNTETLVVWQNCDWDGLIFPESDVYGVRPTPMRSADRYILNPPGTVQSDHTDQTTC